MAESSDALHGIYAAALDAMKSGGPSPLPRRVKFEAEERGAAALAAPSILIAHIAAAPPGDRLYKKLRLTLAGWDAATLGTWVGATLPRTEERRELIYELLALDADTTECLAKFIPAAVDKDVVVSRQFKPWYGRVMAERPSFYWDHYADHLSERWDEDAVAALDLNTTRVVERLGDPEATEAFQAKGLVVGYVQSGKTANFTGVLTKAIDAGYRLIIVLTGTTDLLREQTQRRIDKELVGVENLLRGIDPGDDDALQSVDYVDDPDWDKFVSHGDLPSRLGATDVLRLTTRAGDYKSLAQGISSLDFEPQDPMQPLNAAVNLHRVPARIAIVKKNKTVLTKLVKDLKRITAKLGDIPTLIIDDESDQASINTTNPDKWEKGRPERTAINGLISQLLKLLPRGQYVGYTATPFANVFVDPSDAVDVFPRDFILSLDRAPGYMGAVDFHDLDRLPEDESPTVSNSRELSYVRQIEEESTEAALRSALDMFVLTGAVKLFREVAGEEPGRFKHHTMLVHESVRTADHRALADEIRDLWGSADYYGASGFQRLESLFDDDALPVVAARSEGELVPPSFAAIKPYIGEVVKRIEGSANDPVLVVNSDKEASVEDVDFDRRAVWRILVGGAKLSRGFTVEGLTVSYYRRVTKQADTLMQMGRWFGFRDGYKDLVRLYIGRGSGKATTAYDLYEAFEAACRSEELFRGELARYAKTVDGVPEITPAQVPPLVAQHLGWLKPAASNKMYNARLRERRSPGQRLEPSGYPEAADAIAHNAKVLVPLVAGAETLGDFSYRTKAGSRPCSGYYGLTDHPDFVAILRGLRWLPDDHFAADLAWLEDLEPDQIKDWAVVLPQHVGKGPKARFGGHDKPRSVFRRQRRRGPLFGAISDPKHRPIAARIAGVGDLDDELATSLHKEGRGAVLVYPVVEFEDEVPEDLSDDEVVVALVFVAPMSTGAPDGRLIQFEVRDKTKFDEPIVDDPEFQK